MKFLKKHALLFLLIENLLVQLYPSQILFYAIIALGLLFIFDRTFWNKESFSKCAPLYIFSLIYLIFQFTVGISTLSNRTLLYLVAKTSTFAIIIVSVVSNWEYNAKHAPKILTYVIFVVLVYGIASGNGFVFSGDRQQFGFSNPNTTSALATFCLAGIIFFRSKKHEWRYIVMGGVILYALLASGGRNALIQFIIILLVWAFNSKKRRGISIGTALLLGIIISVFSLNLAGVNRIKNTIKGEEGNNREDVVLATMVMISEKPVTGWGFFPGIQGKALEISDMGSHNGYLDTILFMGYPFAILWFSVMGITVLGLMKYLKRGDDVIKYHLAIVLSGLFAAFYESLLTGVHEISTNIIFYSLAVLTTCNYREKHQLKTVV